ncbi:uroporphyrinogen-III C-methyltransferase [Fodinicurvata fenggangensis]|uniref:uroporphyrinogen-III C-methyltransferase n=1 Tax=Fodinicurvata fenggangensis TaxID=1121830 RepID=UPI002AC35B96|nr:uroporphyrinogen-III C-methyltransferase [Fodinicurvata fenggangensis]
MPNFEPGWVWLAGAGPGDPALLTLASVHALRSADAVIYDALVGKDILSLAGEDTLLEYAGKRGGKPSAKQVDITLRIIELARQGKRVLRLKGGDPFVFGRGGEEALALVDAGIHFRIIPGISAGIGGLAYAGIPVTHRDTNSLVTFLTGHDATGLTPSAIDWKAVARSSPVIVMYMALKHLTEIRDRLMEGGRRADEPLAIISQATLSDQKVLETTLGEAPQALEESGIQPPAMVVLGEVVRLRAALDWVGALSGRQPQADPLGVRQASDAG